jgi:hypothetical protein
MVVDVITFNGEHDLFEIRYNILKEYVDEFIVVEFDQTFSGKPKVFTFTAIKYEKVKYFLVDETVWGKYTELAKSSPNTDYGKGADHWIREFCQKESIKDCLTHLKDDDTVYIGDCDEIWNPFLCQSIADSLIKLKFKVYTYYLNQRSNERFAGTLRADKYQYIKHYCLNHLRTKTKQNWILFHYGWHFTSLKDGLRQKLMDSYTKESYATSQVLNNLDENIKNNRDFLGRDFKYWIDEKDWPQYLKDNREKYLHLLK